MFAAVPCYNLKALHYEVQDDMPAPRSLLGAWREIDAGDLYSTNSRQTQTMRNEFDTPLPPTAGAGGRTKAGLVVEEEGSSIIGDLAPAGLKSE